MEVKFVEPSIDLIDLIAKDMRQADVSEIWASDHYTPKEALVTGLDISHKSVVITIDNEPVVIIGLVIKDILPGVGVPWMLGTNNCIKYKRYFITLVPAIINEMLDVCPKLFNYVHINNKVSIQWLKRIGFSFDKAEPYGCDNELFYKFHLERI